MPFGLPPGGLARLVERSQTGGEGQEHALKPAPPKALCTATWLLRRTLRIGVSAA